MDPREGQRESLLGREVPSKNGLGEPCSAPPPFKDFIYSFMRHTERGRDIGRGRSRLHAGPYTGFDPRTPGSQSQPKAVVQPLSCPGTPTSYIIASKEIVVLHVLSVSAPG